MTLVERFRQARQTDKNVGGVERLLRGSVGPALVVGGVAALVGVLTLAEGMLGVGLAVVAILAGARMTQTALTQRCYMNAMLGRDTYRNADAEPESSTAGETDA